MEHDHSDGSSYTRRCYCEKCTRKYDDWCKEHEKEGRTFCKKKCVTHCEYKCYKPIKIVKEWGYKKEFSGKWEKYAEKCDKKHQHDKKDCGRQSESGRPDKHANTVQSSD